MPPVRQRTRSLPNLPSVATFAALHRLQPRPVYNAVERWHPFPAPSASPAPASEIDTMNEMLSSAFRPWDKGQQRAMPEGAKLRATGCLRGGSAASDNILSFPPILPNCHLDLQFNENEQMTAVPPAFYAGATIPTLVTLVIGRPTCLPHSLNPRLVMAMTGTLKYGSEVRTIISVSVSLAEGLVLWTRDAVKAHRQQVPPLGPRCNPTLALPGGRYSLPLTVSIPNIKLPPTYDTKDGRFSVTYNLSISLLCDDPTYPTAEPVVLSEMSKPFVMLPVTMPEPAPALRTFSCNIPPETEKEEQPTALEETPSWTIAPTLPTTTFSPTSVVPITLAFTSAPRAASQNVFIRLQIVHRQVIAQNSKQVHNETVLAERVLRQRHGVFHIMGGGRTTTLRDLSLPLLLAGGSAAGTGIWEHGVSSTVMLPSDPAADDQVETEVAANFLVRVELYWLGEDLAGCDNAMPLNRLSPVSTQETSVGVEPAYGNPGPTTRDYPILVGSVSEPRDALHYMKWNDLCIQQDTVNGQRVERAHLVHGGGYSSENGWLVAPPSYGEAIEGSATLQPGSLIKEDIRIEVD